MSATNFTWHLRVNVRFVNLHILLVIHTFAVMEGFNFKSVT